MKINQFFEQTLGANLKNPRWSWGAVEPVANRVYLRIWEDQIESHGKGNRVQVYWKKGKPSPGRSERVKHLEAIKAGAEGIGIVCQVEDPTPNGPRVIKAFKQSPLFRLGAFTEDNDLIYAQIGNPIPLADLEQIQTAQNTLATDLQAIFRSSKLGPTVKEALVMARLGQGAFRASVLGGWDQRCAVTGSSTTAAIRASHIKPWKDSTNQERLDPHNGLPLVASVDALFDAGLVSFNDDGSMLVSARLTRSEREIFSVVKAALLKKPSPEAGVYLAYHRANRFKDK